MTNHPREDGLLEWVKEQVEACDELRSAALRDRHATDAAIHASARDAFKEAQKQIESRGPLLDVGEVRERLKGLPRYAISPTGNVLDRPDRGAFCRFAEVLDTFTQPEEGGDGLGADPSRDDGKGGDHRTNPAVSVDSVTTSGSRCPTPGCVLSKGHAVDHVFDAGEVARLVEESGPETSRAWFIAPDGKTITCRRCNTVRPISEAHCEFCGAPLPPLSTQPPALPVEEGGE